MYGGEEFRIKAVPDSGAQMSLIATKIAFKHKVPLNNSNVSYNVRDVQQKKVSHGGLADFEVSSNGVKTAIRMIVSDKIGDNMLISYQDLLKFQVIPQNFPYEVLTYSVTTDVLEDIKREFADVLSDHLNPIPMKSSQPMKIHLKEDAKPLRIIAARRVPKRFEEPAADTILDLIEKGVLIEVKEVTDWCNPGFFVPKGDGRVRLVTDFTHLNKYVKRPIHPFPSTRDILQAIPHDAVYFIKLDAVHGYFQLALSEESSYLTTFLLQQGKYRYLRAPMGLNASSDEWCCHSDAIISGLPWARKIVDDTLIWGKNLEELKERAAIVLERCRDLNITISLKKLELGKEISFAGHIISQAGIRPDDSKYKAIADFPAPKNVSQLRSFLGLANQLTAFVPDLAHMTAKIRPLLKKGIAWNWTADMQLEFEKVKLLLTTTTTVKPFNPELKTILMTDASRLHGIGFALVQPLPEEKWSLIQCGSASLTPTQARYATIELECMAIQWGTQKCAYYLRGLPTFEVWTDHKPLVGIFSKNICDLENPRLMRMREKMMEYSPEVKWVPGKTHYIADALSRSPLFEANEEEYTVSCSYISVETAWESIKEGAKDQEYMALTKAIKDDKPLPKNSPYRTLYDRLSIRQIEDTELACLDSTRLVVPMNSQKAVLKELHRAHSGMQKTYATACQLYYWPGMKNCIKTFISRCSICQKFAPAQPRTHVTGTAPSAAISPMSDLGMDLFDALGKKWLAVVCRFSGYAWLLQLNKTTTSAILAHLVTLFQEFGYPTVIRSDGGPQFRSEFIEFCKKNAIKHELASPYK